MLIAHLPSGYLLGRAGGARGPAMAAALFGAVAPDLDMFWFHFVDHGRVLHHEYWTHLPAFWLIAGLVTLPLLRLFAPRCLRPAGFFLAAVFLHLVLDTFVGGIFWGWPVDHRQIALAVVPATHDHWVMNFILHWSFLPEIAITLAAIWLWWRDRARGRVATARGAR